MNAVASVGLSERLMALFLGGGLGLVFFGGLWFTVQRLVRVARPAPWLLASFVLRLGVVLSGFYLLRGSWQSLVAGMLGFLVARALLTRQLGRREVAGGVKS